MVYLHKSFVFFKRNGPVKNHGPILLVKRKLWDYLDLATTCW